MSLITTYSSLGQVTLLHTAATTPPVGLPVWAAGIASGRWGTISLNTVDDVSSMRSNPPNPNYPSGGSAPKFAAPWAANSGLQGLVDSWSGGCLCPDVGASGTLVILGGAHAAYYGSEVYQFDLATQVWSRPYDPYPGPLNWPFPTGLYPDGTPLPAHNYHCVQYHPPSRSLMFWGNQVNAELSSGDSGNTKIARGYLLDMDTHVWRASPIDGAAGSRDGRFSCYDSGNDVFWLRTAASALTKFDPKGANGDGTYGSTTNYSNRASEAQGAMALVPKLNASYPDQGLQVFTQPSGQSYNVGVWAQLTNSPTTKPIRLNIGGVTPEGGPVGMASYHGFEWSARRQSLIYWRRAAPVWELRPPVANWAADQWTWSPLLDAGNSVVPAPQVDDNGRSGGFRVAAYGTDEFAVVNTRFDGPVYAFRIP